MTILALLLLLASGAQAPTPGAAASPLTAITVYNGTWEVTPIAKTDLPPKHDPLVNRCTLNEAFYTCEQVVNGKSVAMVVFVAGDKPGIFASQAILTSGHAAGFSQLTIVGPHWTFLSYDETGKPSFRVENIFTGRNRIHSEQFKAEANGSWTKVGEQSTVRVAQ